MGFPGGWTRLDGEAGISFLRWETDPADLDPSSPHHVPRIAANVLHRTARLKALGNAQVPAQAALAWAILSDPGFDVG